MRTIESRALLERGDFSYGLDSNSNQAFMASHTSSGLMAVVFNFTGNISRRPSRQKKITFFSWIIQNFVRNCVVDEVMRCISTSEGPVLKTRKSYDFLQNKNVSKSKISTPQTISYLNHGFTSLCPFSFAFFITKTTVRLKLRIMNDQLTQMLNSIRKDCGNASAKIFNF